MPFTPPTSDDLTALEGVSTHLKETASALEDAAGVLTVVQARLSVPVEPPPPPPPALVLPEVGICGASTFNALTRPARQAALALIRAAGITHFRFDASWVSIERTKGVYNLAPKVELATDIIAAGLIPVAVVAYAPPFYRRVAADQFSAPTQAAVDQAWPVFLRALFAALYAVGVRRYEMWNEPNHAGPPGMSPVLPELYADLCLEAHAVASDISRHIQLVAGVISPAPDKLPSALGGTSFLKAILAYEPEFFRFVDEWSLHPYPGMSATTPKRALKLLDGWFWRQQYATTRALVPTDIPICATECGWSTFEMSETTQAEMIVDGIRTWPERGVFYLFNWQDWGATAARDNRQGLLRVDGKPKASYQAVKDLLTA